jgi:DNA-directed RNA polymerase subunit RPC12/RpoP
MSRREGVRTDNKSKITWEPQPVEDEEPVPRYKPKEVRDQAVPRCETCGTKMVATGKFDKKLNGRNMKCPKCGATLFIMIPIGAKLPFSMKK